MSESQSDELPEVLTADELAILLRVDRKSAYAALARGEIPGARRIGRHSETFVEERLVADVPARGGELAVDVNVTGADLRGRQAISWYPNPN